MKQVDQSNFNNINTAGSTFTPALATAASHDFPLSDIAVLFIQLNDALAAAIDAERDLDHLNGSDPSVDPWLREAEAAWRNVDAILVALSAAPIRHASDQALLAVSTRVAALMDTHTIADFCRVFDGLRLAAFARRISGLNRTSASVRNLLDQCHRHLSDIAQLDLYQPVCDADDLPHSLYEPWPEAC